MTLVDKLVRLVCEHDKNLIPLKFEKFFCPKTEAGRGAAIANTL
jgi:hypothetical protein